MSRSVISITFYWLQVSYKPTQIQEEGTHTLPPDERNVYNGHTAEEPVA